VHVHQTHSLKLEVSTAVYMIRLTKGIQQRAILA